MNLAAVSSLQHGEDGILVAGIHVPGSSDSVFSGAALQGIASVLDALTAADVRGLVLVLAKPEAGGESVHALPCLGAHEAFDAAQASKALLRRLETQGKPVAAALPAGALGVGWELALACHARFAIDAGCAKFGQPALPRGLPPAAGATVRLPRLVGIKAALPMLAQGLEMTPAEALAAGLLHGLVNDHSALLTAAGAWCLAQGTAPVRAPWDTPGFRFPGGDSRTPAMAQFFAMAPAVASRDGELPPALLHLMSSLFEGGLLGFDAASTVESRCFAAAMLSRHGCNDG